MESITFDKLSNAKLSDGPGFGARKEALMSRGGRREGAGRPKGAMNLRTRALLEAVSAGGETPIGYMIRVMRDQNAPSARRDKMALAAATYLHARLSSTSAEEDEEPEGEGAPPPNGETANGEATNGGGLK
jgi:hypothetical protein